MRMAEIIGKVTLSRWHPSLAGARWIVGAPLDHTGLLNAQNGIQSQNGRGEPFVIYDELAPGDGAIVAISEGAEAAAPFHPNSKPIDAYCAAIIDQLDLEPQP